eukprot:CAMPEP_0116878030 /NCGR_PEP_ID=MMETSP0463-20121206/9778_1 /TAXON_ID=181622 /ORGANISM="Strombidinopsis sp, Strain SopsisLIS2011" /LENGTH=64 /DNA_ID=CAMNT_0004525839 /DNA_START=880 /DNA_END=1074 /DNA_ORIENTATION=+
MDHDIPKYHQRVTTPDGRLYIIGGLEQNGKRLSSCREMNFEKNELISRSPMITARSDSVCVFDV